MLGCAGQFDGQRIRWQTALAARPAAAPSRTRNMAALAAVAVTGGATRYELPEPRDGAEWQRRPCSFSSTKK